MSPAPASFFTSADPTRAARRGGTPSKRGVAAWTAQADATLALLTKHLGPCELIAILPHRRPHLAKTQQPHAQEERLAL